MAWWDLPTYALRIDTLLGLVLAAADVITLRRLGMAPITAEHKVLEHRALGIAAWFVALSAGYTLAGAFTAAAAAASAALAAWLLLPADQARRAARVLTTWCAIEVGACWPGVAGGDLQR